MGARFKNGLIFYNIKVKYTTNVTRNTRNTAWHLCPRCLRHHSDQVFRWISVSLRGSGKGHEQLWHWKSNLIDTGNHRYRCLWFCKTTGKTHSVTHVWPEAVPSVFDDLCQMAAQVASGQVKHADIEQIHTQGLILGRNCCGLKATIGMFCGWSTKSRFKQQHYFETF